MFRTKWLLFLLLAAAVIGGLAGSSPARLEAAPLLAPTLGFSTYLGGVNEDTIRDIAVDSQGYIYTVGGTASSTFPTTAGAYDRTQNGNMDVFVAKWSPSGGLVWSTFIGGPNYDRAYGVEVDKYGYVYVTGRAGRGFPVTANAFQKTFMGYNTGSMYAEQNAFIAKLKPDGSGLVWSSYYGPVAYNRDLAIDSNGDIYVATGLVGPETSQFNSAWFANAYQKSRRGSTDDVVAKIKSDGTAVLWATYFGGSATEGATPSIRVDAAGNPVLLSGTSSTDLPTTTTAYDRSFNGGGWDLFVAKFSATGSSLLAATYLGGSDIEFTETHGLALDSAGNVYVAATTSSTNFPTTVGAFQRTFGGKGGAGTGASTNYPGDAIVAKLSPDLSKLIASTYLGGRYGEGAEGITVDGTGNIYVSGATFSDNFPVTAGAMQTTNHGSSDVFAVKLAPDLSRLISSTYFGGSNADYGRNIAVDASGSMYVGGSTQSTNMLMRTAYQSQEKGGLDGLFVKIIP